MILPIIRTCKECGLEATLMENMDKFVQNTSCAYGRAPICKECHKIKARKSRKDNPTASRKAVKKYRLNNIEKLNNYIGDWKCSNCGFKHSTRFPFDFHHSSPTTKEYTIGDIMHHSWERIKKEVDKCVLLCANCHRIEHERLDNEYNI